METHRDRPVESKEALECGSGDGVARKEVERPQKETTPWWSAFSPDHPGRPPGSPPNAGVLLSDFKAPPPVTCCLILETHVSSSSPAGGWKALGSPLTA
ncbi:hypothetical protein EWB00_001632 [Schistosoma japonicum]|uniref:Uncharacterized protein n=1 Tax=Schistosoma japonicum TaxID=6182 RepID=A0A4Z2CK03_SCHJA|nr:hypothetical protein EWB00_001632 [Schistosoma japonicum]